MIEARGLVKRYGSTAAVNDLSFTIRPGLVTGFLGPNGAGKTTTAEGRTVLVSSHLMSEMEHTADHQWPHMSAQDRSGFDATQDTILGLAILGQFIIAVFGTLMITSEYSTGLVRTSLTVMPRRGTLYAAKAAVLAAVSLVVSFATSFGTFFLGRVLLASAHTPMSLSQPAVLRSLIVTALFIEACGLFAFGIGALVRNTAGALTLSFGCFALVPQLIRALPAFLYNNLVAWVPGGQAINAMTATIGGQNPDTFPAWGELAVFAGYAAILLAAGAVLFSRRDA